MSAWTWHSSDGKAAPKIVPPRSRTPRWKGLASIPNFERTAAGPEASDRSVIALTSERAGVKLLGVTQ